MLIFQGACGQASGCVHAMWKPSVESGLPAGALGGPCPRDVGACVSGAPPARFSVWWLRAECHSGSRAEARGGVVQHSGAREAVPVTAMFPARLSPAEAGFASEPTGWGAGDPPRAWKDTWVDGPLHCFPSTSSPRSLGDEGTHDSPEQRCREGRTGVRRGQLRARV